MAFLTLWAKYANKALCALFALFVRIFFKVDNKKVLFFSKPDYADNARALSEYVSSTEGSSYKIVWVVEKEENRLLVKDGLSCVLYNCLKCYKLQTLFHLLTAKYICSTHNFPLPYKKKQKEQVYVRLWHGCGYKDKTSLDGTHKVFDVAMVPGPLFIKTKAHFWNIDENDIISLGYPRFDWLKRKSELASSFVSQLRGDAEKAIIWMPTFRNDKNGLYKETSGLSSFPLVKDRSLWFQIDQVCKQFNVVLLVKLHMFQTAYDIPFHEMTNIKELKDDDYSNRGLALYEVLSETDALISDYSSVAIDYLVLDRPIAFCLDDFELYKQNRGFVFENPLQYMPGHHLYKVDDLKSFIHDVAVGNDVHADDRRNVRSVAIKESECYCETVWNKITSL